VRYPNSDHANRPQPQDLTVISTTEPLVGFGRRFATTGGQSSVFIHTLVASQVPAQAVR
jgi:hypothetical protein